MKHNADNLDMWEVFLNETRQLIQWYYNFTKQNQLQQLQWLSFGTPSSTTDGFTTMLTTDKSEH